MARQTNKQAGKQLPWPTLQHYNRECPVISPRLAGTEIISISIVDCDLDKQFVLCSIWQLISCTNRTWPEGFVLSLLFLLPKSRPENYVVQDRIEGKPQVNQGKVCSSLCLSFSFSSCQISSTHITCVWCVISFEMGFELCQRIGFV